MKLVVQNRSEMELNTYKIEAIKCALRESLKTDECEKQVVSYTKDFVRRCLKYVEEQQATNQDIRMRTESAITLNTTIHVMGWECSIDVGEAL